MTTAALKKNPSHFFYHRDRIEQELAKSIVGFGEKTKLRDACEYALTSGGKRFRPLIVILVAEGLGHGLNVYEAALSAEFFHTSTLVADDLPCMDNDDERRGKPTVHKVYGETIAFLASYALMTAGFEKIYRSAEVMRKSAPPFSLMADRACTLVLESASTCAGILGITGGQFLDLFPPPQTLEMVKGVIYKKTVTLFEVSFILGWCFGGGDLSELDKVKKTAFHLGMAFQIADDLGDLVQDEKKEKDVNIVRLIGKERSFLLFEEEMSHFQKKLIELKLYTPSFEKMCATLVQLAVSNAGK